MSNRRQEVELTNMCLIYNENQILLEGSVALGTQVVWYSLADMLNQVRVCVILL